MHRYYATEAECATFVVARGNYEINVSIVHAVSGLRTFETLRETIRETVRDTERSLCPAARTQPGVQVQLYKLLAPKTCYR